MPNTLTPIKKGAFLNESRKLAELSKIRGAIIILVKYKTDRLKLENKFEATKDKFRTRQQLIDREKAQEKKKPKTLKDKLKQKSEKITTGGLFDLLIAFAKIKILLWASDPKNVKIIQGLFEFFKGFFKVIDFFTTIGVEGLLGGLSDLVSPESTTLQRLFGIFKIFGGFFILSKLLRWSNPLNAIKDIQKNKGIISRIFKSIASKDFKSSLDGIRKLATPAIFRKGIGQSIQRVILKVFGKGGLRAVQAIATKLGFKTATGLVKEGVLKTASKIGKEIPLIGPFIGLGINLAMGTPLDVSIVRFAGSILGEWLGRALFGFLGAFLGSVIPVAGTILGGAAGLAVGGFVGNLIGEWLADLAYGWLKSLFGGKKKEEPALAVGGIVTKPTRALIGEAGPEAVIPLGQIYNGTMMSAPLSIIASSMIGGINALITSMGPVGLMFRPFASQLLAPYAREFGVKNYAFSSDLAKKSGNLPAKINASEDGKQSEQLNKIIGTELPLNIISKKQENKQDRYNSGFSVREILGDILNNIINLDFTSGGAGAGGAGGGGTTPENAQDASGVPGSDHQEKAYNYFVKLGLSPEHAAGIVGNLMIESYADIRPNADNGSHHGIAQWDKGDRWPRLISWAQDKNKDPNKFETQLEYLSIESGYVKKYKSMQVSSASDAAQKWEELFERSGGQALSTRQSYANSVLQKYKKMATGGVINPVPTQNIATNKGGYSADTGLDILTPIGSRIVSPVSGILEYAERGHVRQLGQDANPNMSGMQDQHSVRIKLDKPFKYAGKQINFFYATHLYQLNSAISNKSGIKINAGDLLGLSGVANNVPHVHVGFVEDRNQNSFLNYQQVRSLLTGAPVQDAGQSSGSPEGPTGSDFTASQSSTPDWSSIAKYLGDLYNVLNVTPPEPKIDSKNLSTQSMNFLESSKLNLGVSDTYIISQQGNNLISNMNVMTPLPTTDYSISSYSLMDTSVHQSQRRL